MTNLNNKFERTEDQILFEKEIGKWLKKTRLSKTKVNPLISKTSRSNFSANSKV